jgi:hypothetical protein
MSNEKVLAEPEQLDELMKRYRVLGAIAAGSSSFVQWLYDEHGNELKMTVKAGGDATYKETPGKKSLGE